MIPRRLAILPLLLLVLAGCGRLGPPVRAPRAAPAPAAGSAQGSGTAPAEEEEEKEKEPEKR